MFLVIQFQYEMLKTTCKALHDLVPAYFSKLTSLYTQPVLSYSSLLWPLFNVLSKFMIFMLGHIHSQPGPPEAHGLDAPVSVSMDLKLALCWLYLIVP